MPNVQIGYRCPVEVIVDTDAERVVRVTIIDEEVETNRDDFSPIGVAVSPEGEPESPIGDRELARKAIAIAEESDWPEWERGM